MHTSFSSSSSMTRNFFSTCTSTHISPMWVFSWEWSLASVKETSAETRSCSQISIVAIYLVVGLEFVLPVIKWLLHLFCWSFYLLQGSFPFCQCSLHISKQSSHVDSLWQPHDANLFFQKSQLILVSHEEQTLLLHLLLHKSSTTISSNAGCQQHYCPPATEKNFCELGWMLTIFSSCLSWYIVLISESPATSEETEQFGSSVALVHPLFEVTDIFQLAPEIRS